MSTSYQHVTTVLMSVSVKCVTGIHKDYTCNHLNTTLFRQGEVKSPHHCVFLGYYQRQAPFKQTGACVIVHFHVSRCVTNTKLATSLKNVTALAETCIVHIIILQIWNKMGPTRLKHSTLLHGATKNRIPLRLSVRTNHVVFNHNWSPLIYHPVIKNNTQIVSCCDNIMTTSQEVNYWCSSMKPVFWPRARLIFHNSQSHLCCPISWAAQGRLDQLGGCDQESHHPAEDTERRPVSINGHPRCLETEQNNLNLYQQTSGGGDRLDSVSSAALKHISRTTPPLTTFHLQLWPRLVWLTAVIVSHMLVVASRRLEQMCKRDADWLWWLTVLLPHTERSGREVSSALVDTGPRFKNSCSATLLTSSWLTTDIPHRAGKCHGAFWAL